jgi:L-lactate dehydrogenase complex protein LldG
MSDREQILSRVRVALQRRAPMPGGHGSASEGHAAAGREARQWLPAVGQGVAAQLELFGRNLTDLKGEFHLVENRRELALRLSELRQREGWTNVGAHGGSLIEEMVTGLGLPVCRTDAPYDVNVLERCQAGISGCDALVAQTGSVLVTTRSAGGRALSVLPGHHVVVALREQLVADLPEAFALVKKKYSPNYPSFISLITGPSRTGDIERILVLGAHGPKRLTVFCL